MMTTHYNILVKIIIFLIVLLNFSTAKYFLNDDTFIIRQRVLNLTIWPAPDNIPETVRNAVAYAEGLNGSCYWSDINYADKSIVVWSTATHMYRVTTMLQALTVPGSTVQNDTKLFSAVHCALNVWLNNDWQNPNWWFNQINIPLQATSQLLMLGDNATSFQIEKIKDISYRAAWWLHRPQDVGANLVWMIQVQLYRSLATSNMTGIEQGFSRMWQDIAISPLGGEGVQVDWSYHFHGQQLMSGAYGLVWVNNILLFTLCSNNTQYELDQQRLLLFAEFLVQGDAWMIIDTEWDWHVLGRGISGPGNGFANGFQRTWMKSFSKFVQLNETQNALINFVDRLEGKSNASKLTGNKHFFASDYQVHRRVTWVSTIKMQSKRTQPVECINGQNLKDEHGGQGVLNLYKSGSNDYKDIFAIIDWQAINGITVEHDIPLEPCQHGDFPRKNREFVGGVSDGQYGLAMMDTASHDLTAQRSWHFYDDAIISVATNINLNAPRTVWTTLASRLLVNGQITVGFFNSTIITLKDGNYLFPYDQNQLFNVQWIHVGGSDIGYLLQVQSKYASLGLEFGIKTGNYDTIGPYNATVTARMLTLWINHGEGPYTRNYAYITLPNASLDSIPATIKQYEEQQIFSCISTNNMFHGTIWPTLRRASFVLWDNISTVFSCKSDLFSINIQLNEAGAYLFSESDTDFSLTASHPTRINSMLTVTVDRIGYGKQCAILSHMNESTTKITLPLPTSPALLGASVNVQCKK